MRREEVDIKLIKLRKLLSEKEGRYEEVNWELDDLEYEKDNLNREIGDIESQIETLEKLLLENKIKELDNSFTGDKFRDSFIKCSYFCDKSGERMELSHIRITDNQLSALDGYRAIIIDCDCIPDNLKNTYIRWDIREDFESNIVKNINPYSYHNKINEIIKDSKCDLKLTGNINKIITSLHYNTINNNGREIEVLYYGDIKVAFNRKYLNILKLAYEDVEIELYYPKNKMSALVVENNSQKAILLPVRLDSSDYE